MIHDDLYLEAHSADDVRVKGTRVGIEHVLSAYLAGHLPEEIALQFPTVGLEQVHGVIAGYLRQRGEIDAYLRRWRCRARAIRSEQARTDVPEIVRRLRKLAEERVTG
jgi:uncharacterized protein (DUF433 family)